MPVTWFKSLVFALGLVAAWAMPSPAARPGGDVRPEALSLAGQMLVASPDIEDPRFRHAVVLMVQHDATGAFGIIVNRPLAEHPLAQLLGEIGRDNAGVTGRVLIFFGGPVDPTLGFVVHSADYRGAGTIAIDQRLAMTLVSQVLVDIAGGKGPARALVAFGYTGWGPDQLEGEIARGGWFIEPADSDLVFDGGTDKVWADAMARLGLPTGEKPHP
jgi:putative transcriptional regulator